MVRTPGLSANVHKMFEKKDIYEPEEIDAIVEAYKKDVPGAAEVLVHAYKWYLWKFVLILASDYPGGSKIDSDPDVRGFIRLFGHPGRNHFPAVKASMAYLKQEELFQEMVALFLQTSKRWVKLEDGPHFPGYLKSYFKYMVKRWIDRLSKDAINSASRSKERMPDGVVEAIEPEPTEMQYMMDGGEPALSGLNYKERYILYLHTFSHLTDKKIGDKLGIGKLVVKEIRRIATKKARHNVLGGTE